MTNMSLFLVGETLACSHELRSLICINLPSPGVTQSSVHGIGVSTLLAFPSHFPLFCHLQFLVCFWISWVSHAQAGANEYVFLLERLYCADPFGPVPRFFCAVDDGYIQA